MLQNLLHIADAVRASHTEVQASACVLRKDRNGACRKCAEVCPQGCIGASPEGIWINGGACSNCGACTAVCPTSVFDTRCPSAEETLAKLRELSSAQPSAAIACRQFADSCPAVAPPFAIVPCLAHLTEELLCQAALLTEGNIILIDGKCAECEWAALENAIETTAQSAQMLLTIAGSRCSIDRASFLPKELREVPAQGRGAERRRLIEQSGAFLRESALRAAFADLSQPSAQQASAAPEKWKQLASRCRRRNESIMDALCQMGQPLEATFPTRLFGTVEITSELCDGCGLCSLYCPTEALVKTTDASGTTQLEFRTSECVQCRICEGLCPRRCISVSESVSTADLFNLEPRVAAVPSADALKPQLAHVAMETEGIVPLPRNPQDLKAILRTTVSLP